jgi:MFS superfamily sulfate permease-like transporter
MIIIITVIINIVIISFQGYITSDCGAVDDVEDNHHYTSTPEVGHAASMTTLMLMLMTVTVIIFSSIMIGIIFFIIIIMVMMVPEASFPHVAGDMRGGGDRGHGPRLRELLPDPHDERLPIGRRHRAGEAYSF